jgi:hypothetical protein
MMADQKMEEEWLEDTYWVAVDVCDEECGRPRERNAVFIEDSCARINKAALAECNEGKGSV